MSGAGTSALIDCTSHDDGELFIVEGKHAANALRSVRDRRCQAILPMQGKVPNAVRSSRNRLIQHPQLNDLLCAINPQRMPEPESTSIRYRRLLLLNDPDFDGHHAGSLLILFFYCYLPHLIEAGHLYNVQAPLFGLYRESECVALAYSDEGLQQQLEHFKQAGAEPAEVRRYKGIASIEPAILSRECVSAKSRRSSLLTIASCEAVTRHWLPN